LLNLVTIDERLIRFENRIVSRSEFTDTTENKNYDFDMPADTIKQLQLYRLSIIEQMCCCRNGICAKYSFSISQLEGLY